MDHGPELGGVRDHGTRHGTPRWTHPAVSTSYIKSGPCAWHYVTRWWIREMTTNTQCRGQWPSCKPLPSATPNSLWIPSPTQCLWFWSSPSAVVIWFLSGSFLPCTLLQLSFPQMHPIVSTASVSSCKSLANLDSCTLIDWFHSVGLTLSEENLIYFFIPITKMILPHSASHVVTVKAARSAWRSLSVFEKWRISGVIYVCCESDERLHWTIGLSAVIEALWPHALSARRLLFVWRFISPASSSVVFCTHTHIQTRWWWAKTLRETWNDTCLSIFASSFSALIQRKEESPPHLFLHILEPVTHGKTQCQLPHSVAVLLLCVPCVKCLLYPLRPVTAFSNPHPIQASQSRRREIMSLRNDKFCVIVSPPVAMAMSEKREKVRRGEWVRPEEEQPAEAKWDIFKFYL